MCVCEGGYSFSFFVFEMLGSISGGKSPVTCNWQVTSCVNGNKKSLSYSIFIP